MPLFDNHHFYKEAFERNGISPQAVHWNSKYTQYKRFEIITDFIEQDISSSSLVDVGCGFGEYFYYLKQFNLKPKEYIGLDCEEYMIQHCKRRFPSQKFYIKDVLKNQLPKKEYYVCSGAMNILHEEEFFQFLQNCYDMCTKAFIFNFLTQDSFNQISTNKIINYCDKLDSTIQINKKYLYNDMTICLQKAT